MARSTTSPRDTSRVRAFNASCRRRGLRMLLTNRPGRREPFTLSDTASGEPLLSAVAARTAVWASVALIYKRHGVDLGSDIAAALRA